MTIKVMTKSAYDAEGRRQVLEAYSANGSYVLLVNGAFYCTAESMREILDEIEDVMQWYGWVSFMNPIYA